MAGGRLRFKLLLRRGGGQRVAAYVIQSQPSDFLAHQSHLPVSQCVWLLDAVAGHLDVTLNNFIYSHFTALCWAWVCFRGLAPNVFLQTNKLGSGTMRQYQKSNSRKFSILLFLPDAAWCSINSLGRINTYINQVCVCVCVGARVCVYVCGCTRMHVCVHVPVCLRVCCTCVPACQSPAVPLGCHCKHNVG